MKKIILILVLMTASLGANAQQSLIFGVIPQQFSNKVTRLWEPIIKYIEKETGIKIHLETTPNIPTFEKSLAAGKYDLSYMNPYHYVVFSKNTGYKALSKAYDKRIKGIIVAHKHSEIESINDLNQSALAFPEPTSFAASILPRYFLSKNRVSFTPNYVSSHDSVYSTVAKSIYPAGGGVIRTFNNTNPEIREQLKIVWTSKGYTPHAIASHPRVNKSNVKKIQKSLINMKHNVVGKKLLESIKIQGFEAGVDHDWNDVRALNVHLLEKESR